MSSRKGRRGLYYTPEKAPDEVKRGDSPPLSPAVPARRMGLRKGGIPAGILQARVAHLLFELGHLEVFPEYSPME